MEVVAASPSAGGGASPFHNHDVREWSRIDSLTGVLERARLETDHWTANTSNASHKYGKVVDSRARSGADGAVQQRAKRQLEVFQSQVPGGRLQVIKTHTVSTSRWTNKSPNALENKRISPDFEGLQLALNPLDLSSQKSKASVGRSVGRRPPSRPRTRDEITTSTGSSISDQQIQSGLTPFGNVHGAAATNLHRVSRLCHQIHENAVKQTFGKYSPKAQQPSIHERQNGDGSTTVETLEIENGESTTLQNDKETVCGHTNLIRTKSTSSEDLHLIPERDKTKSTDDLEDLEQLQSWRRTSKIRRSLQFPKQNKPTSSTRPSDLPENIGSVRKIREDLETGRRLSTALRGNNVDLEALDQILQSISSSSSIYSDKNGSGSDKYEEPERDGQISVKKQKRNSFVTVESIQEVRGRLRRTSSPTSDIYQDKKEEEIDDGIVTEEIDQKVKASGLETGKMESRVKSYVYGMENGFHKKSVNGTGSLESRSKQYNNNYLNRNEDWYNRRKSYGFEQVHNQQEQTMSSKTKNKVESSTDSGICRSTEIVVVPTIKVNNKSSEYSSESDTEDKDPHHVRLDDLNESSELTVGSVKRYSSLFDRKDNNVLNGNSKKVNGISVYNRHLNFSDKNSGWQNKDLESTTITIPIGSKTSLFGNKNVESSSFLNKNGENVLYKNPDISFYTNKNLDRHTDANRIGHWGNINEDKEIKRHSIAVDECKYVTKNTPDSKYRRTSLAINDKMYHDAFSQDNAEDDSNPFNKRTKKVEFCKTEVHFAADSGKVNIVETDEKPPPTQNFRRRRRNSGLINSQAEEFNKIGLPVLHFGDTSFEKTLFGVPDSESSQNGEGCINVAQTKKETVSCTTVTVNSNLFQQELEEDQKENIENEVRKGILKNKPIKPKPYLLGEMEPLNNGTDSDNQENRWGVRLKPVNKEDGAIWRSTVTVRNTYYDGQNGFSENNIADSSFIESLSGNNLSANHLSGSHNSVNNLSGNNISASNLPENNQSGNNLSIVNSSVSNPLGNNLFGNGLSGHNFSGNSFSSNNTSKNIHLSAINQSRENVSINEIPSETHQPEFQKLLRTLRPASSRKSESFCEVKRNSGNFNSIKIEPPLVDNRRACWSVADRIKQVEDLQWSENKGYSTKVNIGGGEATVVENGHDRNPTWPRREDSDRDERKQILNKGLVVRIGREDSSSKHTVCSKTTTNTDTSGITTTTKITIDLTPSPTNDKSRTEPIFCKTNPSTHSFKSTSLILSTIKSENDSQVVNRNNLLKPVEIPKQLEALRKLYEDVHSDTEADKEVQSLMSKLDEDVKQLEDDNSSIISGSWSKMRAFKNISQHFNKTVSKASDLRIGLNFNAITDKDYSNLYIASDSEAQKYSSRHISNSQKQTQHSERNENMFRTKTSTQETNYSPVVFRKSYPIANKTALKSAVFSEKLSSPSLVASKNEKNSLKPADCHEVPKHIETEINNTIKEIEKQILSEEESRQHLLTEERSRDHNKSMDKSRRLIENRKIFEDKRKFSEEKSKSTGNESFKKQTVNEQKSRNQLVVEEKSRDKLSVSQHKSPTRTRPHSPFKEVLRQPKKSEMAYFGVPVSPPPHKRVQQRIVNKQESKLTEQPDLLQFNTSLNSASVTNKIEIKKFKKSFVKEPQLSPEPIYENIEEIRKHKNKIANKKVFDSSILEELTKAADQIMQAVNGYTDEDSQNRLSTDDEERKRSQMKREPLDTISETKSWKQNTTPTKAGPIKNQVKSKLKHTSSNSSIDSITRECRKSVTPVRSTSTVTKTSAERQKKKVVSTEVSPSIKASTKARRLQRASSREALLQSHGSSSEDLGINIEVPLRKPRLVRRTKTTQLTITNGIEMKKPLTSSTPIRKKEDTNKIKQNERVPVMGLPEIRHKTAVSTIRSTAEKAASRERKLEDTKKKPVSKKETSRGYSTPVRTERSRVVNGREVVSHRVSTANIKKCSRTETSPRH